MQLIQEQPYLLKIMKPIITAIIPAAGMSQRMLGKDKLLEFIGDETLLHRSIRNSIESKITETIVITRIEHHDRRESLRDLSVRHVIAQCEPNILSESLKCGVSTIDPDIDGILIHLPDMPMISSSDINTLIDNYTTDHVLRGCTSDKIPGHPVLVPKNMISILAEISGDSGAGTLLKNKEIPVKLISLAWNHAILDLDTPEDWNSWMNREKS